MCITLADADAIVAARDRTGKVVQVGYMKRFDPAYELLLEEIPSSALRYISVVVNDPEFRPFFTQGEIVRGEVAPEVVEATRHAGPFQPPRLSDFISKEEPPPHKGT